ncbi:MAG TPA: beta-phosphoglucomutase [Candidatus Atribacteria bacterium]|nr:beta-phosphoglucomutase [Candidatus Atribacteria bacterium]
MRYKAVIFDLDGVLCHTDKYHYMAWKQITDKLGVYFDELINNRLRGVSRMDSLDIILENYAGPPLSDEEKAILAAEKNEAYRSFLMQMSPKDLGPNAICTLDRLRKGGLRLAIGSSSKNAPLILDRLGLRECFDAVSDGNNIQYSKPHPQVFLMAAEYLGLKPRECLVVEDAKAGIRAAAAAGMDSAAMGDAAGFELATYSIKDIEELPGLVGV